MPSPEASGAALTSRLRADRRGGTDRRFDGRRHLVHGVATERRSVVDRRRGAERRSTLERRGRALRGVGAESPGEHLRNALQLLASLTVAHELDADQQIHLGAALARVRSALSVLERRTR